MPGWILLPQVLLEDYLEEGDYTQPCSSCFPGFYSDTYNASECTACTAPLGAPASGASACCPAGETSGWGSLSCFNCPAGSFLNPGSSTCLACPAGTYNPVSTIQPQSIACLSCPGGLSSSAGATASGVMAASAGTSTDRECVPCAVGFYAALRGACTPCPAGSSCPSVGMSAPEPCPGGQYQPATGQTACISCQSSKEPATVSGCFTSYYGFARIGTCNGIASKQFGDGSVTNPYPGNTSGTWAFASSQPSNECAATGSSSAAACCGIEAYWDGFTVTNFNCMKQQGSITGLNSGIYYAPWLPCACPAGTWANSFTMQCTAYECPAGTYFSPVGATAPVCLPCQPGTFSKFANQKQCSVCLRGQYSAAVGADNCANGCPAGSYSNSSGATACTLCPPDSTSSLSFAAFSCVSCPAGTVAPLAGSPACTPCSPGTYGVAEGAAYVCAPCAAGSFNSGYGATTCTPCAPGTVALSTGATSCTPCPPGSFYTFDAGAYPPAYVCAPCPVGATNSGYGATACALCGVASISPGRGAVACSPCPRGALNNGYQECVACAGGSYLAPNNVCVVCGSGSYSYPPLLTVDGLQGGGTSCEPCPPGTAAPNAGTATCAVCSPGTVSSAVVGSTSCSSVCCGL